jgi:hypothetical protein
VGLLDLIDLVHGGPSDGDSTPLGPCPPSRGAAAYARAVRRPANWDLLTRDAVTSALYVAIVLLAGLVALPQEETDEEPVVASVMLGTAVGLVLAHWFAFRVAGALVDGIGRREIVTGAADVLAGLLVGVLAALASLVSTTAAMVVLGAVIGGTGYAVGHRAGARPLRSIAIALAILVVASVVVAVKLALGH